MTEQTFFNQNGVTVTNARAIFPGKTYFMANVTSVSIGMIPASRGAGIVLALVGLAIAAAANGGAQAFGVLLLLAGIAWAVMSKAIYQVKLASAGGEAEALQSKDKPFIDQVVNALNNAMIHRG